MVPKRGRQIVLELDRVFERSELTSAEVDPDAMRGTYAMPNGGLFSFGGRYCRNFRLGRYDACATDRAQAVVLRFGEHVVVLTPRDPERFVEAVRP